jgi:hypothetical protein
MRTFLIIITFACISLFSSLATSHGKAEGPDQMDQARPIEFPNTANLLTLVVDLHTHSVFSDGHVWPRIRVDEALKDGLDAMAVTEHLEYQPHIEDIPHPDRNQSYNEALASLPDGEKLIVIAGSEITRRPPHGHMNAVFIQDANLLFNIGKLAQPYDVQRFADAAREWPVENALAEAKKQNAFVFWNHSWSNYDNRITEMTKFHRDMISEGKLHGIEIANGDTYSPESFAIALKHNLTPIGVSDVHELIDWDYEPHKGGHRPVNLVFAKERSADAVHQALLDGNTVVWFRNLLLGKQQPMQNLLAASIQLSSAIYPEEDSSVLEIIFTNVSDATFQLENLTGHTVVQGHKVLEVPPHSQRSFGLRMKNRVQQEQLKFRVLNALIEPNKHPEMAFDVLLD